MTHEVADKAFREWWDTWNGDNFTSSAEDIALAAWQACESQMQAELSGYHMLKEGYEERVRAAVAEMREKAAQEVADFDQTYISHRRPQAILALPINGDPHWLAKQLLDARIEGLKQIIKKWRDDASSTPGVGGRIKHQVADDLANDLVTLTAERRALEGK